MMLGICWLHASGRYCGHPTEWLSNISYWCVTGFVFLTGWFGLRFSVRKLVKLYLVAIYAVIIIYGLKCLLGDRILIEAGGGGMFGIKILRSFWFLNGYAVLMLMAPTLNKITDAGDMQCISPILFIVFVWGFLNSFPPVWSVMPKSSGVEPYSGIMMMGVYVVGRLFRRNEIYRWFNRKQTICLLLVSIVAVAMGLCSYCSPFSLAIAIIVFFGFNKSRIAHDVGKRFAWMAPSIFSIYLLHAHSSFGFKIISWFEDMLVEKGIPLVLVYVISAFVIFTAGLLLDIPRRLIIWGYKASKERFCERAK